MKRETIGEEDEAFATDQSEKLEPFIGTIEEAEPHHIDNIYLVRGYRVNHHSWRSVFGSLFTCHNEFVNVWSHICGVLTFIILATVVAASVMPYQFPYAKELSN